MKAERIAQPPAFQPVTLTLETQAEVDGVFALLNVTKLSRTVELHDAWEELERFTSGNAAELHSKLCRVVMQ